MGRMGRIVKTKELSQSGHDQDMQGSTVYEDMIRKHSQSGHDKIRIIMVIDMPPSVDRQKCAGVGCVLPIAMQYNIIRRQMTYSAKKEYKPINDKAIIPLTLYQINTQLTEDSIFDEQSFYTLSIVARLENFRRENNSNMFLFCDGTGQLEGRINLTSGRMPAFAEGLTFEDKYGDYFFVVFKPKFSEGEKKFYIQMIKPLDNPNLISKHFSDVMLSSLIRKRNN